MATVESVKTISLQAAADLSALQFTFVTTNSSGKAAAATAGADITGVLFNKPVLDQAATVGIDGIAKVKAGAAVTAGTKVMSDGTGRAIAATGGGTNHVAGEAMETAAAAGEIIRVRISSGPKFILV